MHDGVLKSVAYFFRKINPVKCNYMIYNKELLAIINNFENWRSELTKVHGEVKMLLDHQNLEYFMITKDLSCRQVCWTELLFEFNFKIKFRSRRQGAKLDALICRFRNFFKETTDEKLEYQRQTVLKENQLDKEIVKFLKSNTIESTLDIMKTMLDKAYENDILIKEIIDLKNRGERKLFKGLTKKGIKIAMRDIEVKENRVYLKGRF